MPISSHVETVASAINHAGEDFITAKNPQEAQRARTFVMQVGNLFRQDLQQDPVSYLTPASANQLLRQISRRVLEIGRFIGPPDDEYSGAASAAHKRSVEPLWHCGRWQVP